MTTTAEHPAIFITTTLPPQLTPRINDLDFRLSGIVSDVGQTLTRRQVSIVCEIATGATNHQIARRLRIAESTVDEHVRNIKDRLGVEDRVTIGIIGDRWMLRHHQIEL